MTERKYQLRKMAKHAITIALTIQMVSGRTMTIASIVNLHNYIEVVSYLIAQYPHDVDKMLNEGIRLQSKAHGYIAEKI